MSTTTARPADALREGDTPVEAAPSGAARRVGGIAGWVDDRTGAAKPVGYLMKKVFPDHWSFMLGEIAMYSMIICLITGAFLTFWFVPSAGHTVYDGSFVPLRGVGMSEAYASTLNISFDIKGGLIIRQIHHWAALMFIVALTVHMFRVFFTGAFRKPREINWVIGTVLALLAIVEGFAGYSLPDDLLSGTGIRAMAGFVQTAPVIGTYLVYGIFGGPFPGEMIIPRLYSVHILLLPAILIGLFTAHIGLVFVQKHTQYPGPGRTNENVVGFPVMPVYAAKAGGFFFIVFGVLAMISALVQINPVWAYGPYDPSPVTAGSQPDWYMGFADGALRLLPGWLEFEFWGYTLSLNIALGALVLLPLVYTVLGIYPFVERWVTKDDREHHLLDRPRNNPDPHRHRHGGHHRLLGLHVRRGQRHHGDQAGHVDQRHHLVLPHRAVRPAAADVLGHQAHLPVAAASRPRHRPARPGDGHHHPHPGRQVLRASRHRAHRRPVGAGAARPGGSPRARDRGRRARCGPQDQSTGQGQGGALEVLLRGCRQPCHPRGTRRCSPPR
jgi:ubiquinol-cytochrome c reductase cytochrome b subunit